MKTLKETIDKELGIGGSGRVNLNAASLASGLTEKTDATAAPEFKEVKGPITTTLEKDEAVDPMLAKGAEREAGKDIAKDKIQVASSDEIKRLMEIPPAMDTVTITDQERSAFIDAIVTGKRYTETVSMFDNRVEVEFRCRSADESHAILSLINRECQDGTINTALDYSTRLRNMLLTAQVKRLNSLTFEELAKPLMMVYKPGVITEKPEWVKSLEYWQNYGNEGVASAIYRQLQLFERKYWVMVGSAVDQNFWQTAGSI